MQRILTVGIALLEKQPLKAKFLAVGSSVDLRRRGARQRATQSEDGAGDMA